MSDRKFIVQELVDEIFIRNKEECVVREVKPRCKKCQVEYKKSDLGKKCVMCSNEIERVFVEKVKEK